MSVLDFVALVILFVLVLVFVAIWIGLGILPGKIAKSRQHPQAEAIEVCGWWGAITCGLLMPLAFIWAYTKPAGHRELHGSDPIRVGQREQEAKS